MPTSLSIPPIARTTPGSRQLAVDRINYILQNLEAAGSVSVADLSETLGVSRETIRRDLKTLAGQGRGRTTSLDGHLSPRPAMPYLQTNTLNAFSLVSPGTITKSPSGRIKLRKEWGEKLRVNAARPIALL